MIMQELTILSLSIFGFLLLPNTMHGSPLNLDIDERPVNIRLIEEGPSTRFKRYADIDDDFGEVIHDLPDRLVFGIPVQPYTDATLTLTKTRGLLPIITSDGPVRPVQMNASVYADLTSQSSMIVRRDTGDYSLQGTFVHSGTEWNLQPSGDESGLSASHRLSPLQQEDQNYISLAGDAYIVKDLPAQKSVGRNMPLEMGAVTHHVVETAFVLDYAEYSRWVSIRGAANALSHLQLWYTYAAESVNIRFKNIEDPDITISFIASVLKVITNDTNDDFIQDLVVNGSFSGQDALLSFKNWVPNQGDLPVSDYYMLFTGYEMTDAAGMAYVGTLCTSSSVSITESLMNGIFSAVVAHELGHSLSSLHDTTEGCDDDDNNIMATVLRVPTVDGSLWKFSSCSVAKFKDLLGRVACTAPAETTLPDALPAPGNGSRAGEVLSLDDQCHLKMENSTVCTSSENLHTICGGMWCWIPESPGYCRMILPQEFTSCGPYQWCVRGVCVGITTTTTERPSQDRLWTCLGKFFTDWREWIACMRGVIGRVLG